MPKNVNDVIAELDPEQRRKVETRAVELGARKTVTVPDGIGHEFELLEEGVYGVRVRDSNGDKFWIDKKLTEEFRDEVAALPPQEEKPDNFFGLKPAPGETPHALSEDEVRDKFLRHIWSMIRYWQTVENPHGDRMEGCVFSILATLDGDSPEVPGFVVSPLSSEEDRHYLKERGDNWYPDPEEGCDIAGGLHEHFHRVGRETTHDAD